MALIQTFPSGKGDGSSYTAGDGIDITNNEISTDNMPTADMSEVISPLPGVMSRRMKYSTEEQVIGEWIGGEPIYQKTVTGVMPNCTTTGTAVTDFLQYSSCGISNVSRVIGTYGFVYNDGTNVYRPFGMQASDGGFVSVIPHSTYADLVNAQPGLSGKTAYITLQYTKTTD